MTAPVTFAAVARSARREMTAAALRRFPDAEAVGYACASPDDDIVLWKVLGADGAELWSAKEGDREVPAWDELGEAVDHLGELVRNAAAYVGSLPAWHWGDLPPDELATIGGAVGDDLTCRLADYDDMRLFRALGLLPERDHEGITR